MKLIQTCMVINERLCTLKACNETERLGQEKKKKKRKKQTSNLIFSIKF